MYTSSFVFPASTWNFCILKSFQKTLMRPKRESEWFDDSKNDVEREWCDFLPKIFRSTNRKCSWTGFRFGHWAGTSNVIPTLIGHMMMFTAPWSKSNKENTWSIAFFFSSHSWDFGPVSRWVEQVGMSYTPLARQGHDSCLAWQKMLSSRALEWSLTQVAHWHFAQWGWDGDLVRIFLSQFWMKWLTCKVGNSNFLSRVAPWMANHIYWWQVESLKLRSFMTELL